jgi:ABC-type sugar transport system permease subunit
MRNTLLIAAWTFTVPFAMPLLVAEAIYNLRSDRAKSFYRIAILVPILIPGMVTLQLWRWLYSFPDGGINLLLRAAGLNAYARPWLGTIHTAMPAILFMGFPWVAGTAALIYYAGLLAIPSETLDAATLDGCSTFRRIRSIDIPHLLGQIRFFMIFGVIAVLQDFGAQLVLTQGGPYGATMVPGLYLYIRAFGIERFDRAYTRMGEACAVGVIMFVLILLFSYLGQRRLRVSGIDVD